MSVAQQTFHNLVTAGLDEVDPDIAALLGKELERQRGQIELIASGFEPVIQRKRRAGFGRTSVYAPGSNVRAITAQRPRSSGRHSNSTSRSCARSAEG